MLSPFGKNNAFASCIKSSRFDVVGIDSVRVPPPLANGTRTNPCLWLLKCFHPSSILRYFSIAFFDETSPADFVFFPFCGERIPVGSFSFLWILYHPWIYYLSHSLGHKRLSNSNDLQPVQGQVEEASHRLHVQQLKCPYVKYNNEINKIAMACKVYSCQNWKWYWKHDI